MSAVRRAPSPRVRSRDPDPRAADRGADAEDRVWRALADPTRRAVLDVLRRGPETTGVLTGRFPMSRFGVMKHLRVLEEAALILVERRGRERVNHLNPVPIQEIHRRWIRPFEATASDRLLRLKQVAERGRDRAKGRNEARHEEPHE